MGTWFKIGALAALVAVIGVGILGANAALAQGPAPATPPAYGRTLGLGPGFGQKWGGPQNSLVAVAAKQFGMDEPALIAELNKGKTIADLAKSKNVSLDKIVNAFMDTRVQAFKDAVSAKRITQAQADSTLADMKKHVQDELTSKLTDHTYGQGRGRGMGRGFVDANKDGICDNCGANRPTGTAPATSGTFRPGGRGMGRGFVDANKDGICDHCGVTPPTGK